MEYRRGVLTDIRVDVSVGCCREITERANNIVFPCRSRYETLDSPHTLPHNDNIDLSVQHIGVDERGDKSIGGLNLDRSAYAKWVMSTANENET